MFLLLACLLVTLMKLAKGETMRVADQTEWLSEDRSVVLNISDVLHDLNQAYS